MCAPLEGRKCRAANIFWNNCFDWRHHKSLVLATLATSYPTNGLVSAHWRLSASHFPRQPAHFTSWLITTFKIYKENTGMFNPGLGETSSISFPNTLPHRSQTAVGPPPPQLWFSRATWQRPCFRKVLSHSAPELWYFNSLAQTLPWEHIIMPSLVMGKVHWVSRFDSVPAWRVSLF